MKKSQGGSLNIILVTTIIVLAGIIWYFTFVKKSSAPISTEPTTQQSSDITITFPKTGSVLLEGQTYNITWSGPEVVRADIELPYLLILEYGGSGSIRIAAINDIISQKSFSWTVPSILDIIKGGDNPPKVAPEDGYRVQIYEFSSTGIEKTKIYSSPVFKIIPKNPSQ